MNYFNEFLKKTGWSSLISSIVFAILGIILIVNPTGMVKFVSYVLGTMFILIGIGKSVKYFNSDKKYDLYNYELAHGIIAIILGIVIIKYTIQIGNIFRIIVGIWITYSSVMRFNFSMKLKTITSKLWIGSLIISILMLLCGVYIIFNSNVILMSIGTLVLVYAIFDIFESVVFLINVNKLN